ncbi:Pyruvate synthase subunit PorA [Candidatus Norongarragalina meridionalis]|nr:Pyruvate synthase subunit PorA [Candidatus Norongarragalina meridionalis]
MKRMMEGSIAVAHVVARCRPTVIAAYPITPSTHVPEELSRIQPEYGYEFITVESEHSAMSACIGASVAGARTFTATSSQGLLYMHEVLFNASGMRLPIVMVVANRSVGAPLNIWNDWQDSISQRDAGWIQLYCKNNQETLDTVIQAYKIAEKTDIPVMVCFEGYYLTHEVSEVDLPEQKDVDAFLPAFRPKLALDTNKPMSFGTFAPPKYYQGMREKQHRDIIASAKVIESVAAEFSKRFKRPQRALLESYKLEGAETVFVTMGSLAETTEVAVDELRTEKKKAGLLRVKCLRPFPSEAVAKALARAKRVVVLEKDVSAGAGGVLAMDVRASLRCDKPVVSVVCGLGGKDVPVREIKKTFDLKKDSWL